MDEGQDRMELGRYIQTAKHLKPVQVSARLRACARRMLWRSCPPLLPRRLRHAAQDMLPLLWGSALLSSFAELRRERAALRAPQVDRLLRGEFMLLNRRVRFDGAVDWHRDDLKRRTPLAGFELHYQAYLEDLALAWLSTGEVAYAEKWGEIVTSWIGCNPACSNGFSRFAWSPYVIAERTRNWLSSTHWLRDILPAELKRAVAASCAEQVSFLAENLEYDLQGNHLLQNLCGLVVVTCLLGGARAEPLRRGALQRLAETVEAQVLEDGMHEERSFAYHVKALADLIEVLTLARSGAFTAMGAPGQRAVGRIRTVAARMAGAVAATWDEVGGLPLMNDTEEIPAQVVRWLLEKASSHGELPQVSADQRCEGSGYLVGSAGPWSAVFDAGAGGPEHQMGHAHADHLSFELWHCGRKLICDSGNSTYDESERRRWYRSTAAHNTIRIDGVDCLELWKSFRVGRRPGRHACQVVESGDSSHCWFGQHDGYGRLSGAPLHRRWFGLSAGGVCVLDELAGQGAHVVESFLHFHPAVALREVPQADTRLSGSGLTTGMPPGARVLRDGRRAAWRWRLAGPGAPSEGMIVAAWPAEAAVRIETERTPYAPAFSTEKESLSLKLAGHCALPLQLGWLITEDARGSSCGTHV